MKDNNDVTNIDRTDGVKFYMKDGWVLMRPSGTEPIFRVYVEAKEKQRAEQLAIFYKNLVESLIQRDREIIFFIFCLYASCHLGKTYK